jgi:hypothetical protein
MESGFLEDGRIRERNSYILCDSSWSFGVPILDQGQSVNAFSLMRGAGSAKWTLG